MTAAIINAPISPSCPNSGVGDAGLKKMALMNRMVNVTAAPQNPTIPMNFASESSCLSSAKLVEEKKFPLSRLQEAYEEASKPGMYRVSVMLDEE